MDGQPGRRHWHSAAAIARDNEGYSQRPRDATPPPPRLPPPSCDERPARRIQPGGILGRSLIGIRNQVAAPAPPVSRNSLFTHHPDSHGSGRAGRVVTMTESPRNATPPPPRRARQLAPRGQSWEENERWESSEQQQQAAAGWESENWERSWNAPDDWYDKDEPSSKSTSQQTWSWQNGKSWNDADFDSSYTAGRDDHWQQNHTATGSRDRAWGRAEACEENSRRYQSSDAWLDNDTRDQFPKAASGGRLWTAGPTRVVRQKSSIATILGAKTAGRRKSKKKARASPKARASSELVADDASVDSTEKAEATRCCRQEVSGQKDAEMARTEQPLALLRDLSTSPKDWEELLADEHLRSWLFVKKGSWSILDDDLNTMIKRVPWEDTIGRTGLLTRRTAWMVSRGCRCPYAYGAEHVQPKDMPPWLLKMMERWLQEFDLGTDLPNCVNLNLYECGAHSVGWHADDEPLFQAKQEDARIISVSLGAARRFRIGMRCPRRKKKMMPAKGTISDVMLEHGDLCTMEGLFQKHFLHQISKNKSQEPAARVNATFRWIVKHDRDCPLHQPCSSDEESSISGRSADEQRASPSGRGGRGRGMRSVAKKAVPLLAGRRRSGLGRGRKKY